MSSPTAQVLLSQGSADAYQMSTDTGWTALMEASAAGSCTCIQALAEEGGADVNLVMDRADGDHPLLAAAAAGDCLNALICETHHVVLDQSISTLSGHLPAIKLLLKLGAKVNRTDKSGRTAIYVAAW